MLIQTEVEQGWKQETSQEDLYLLQQEMMVTWPDL